MRSEIRCLLETLRKDFCNRDGRLARNLLVGQEMPLPSVLRRSLPNGNECLLIPSHRPVKKNFRKGNEKEKEKEKERIQEHVSVLRSSVQSFARNAQCRVSRTAADGCPIASRRAHSRPAFVHKTCRCRCRCEYHVISRVLHVPYRSLLMRYQQSTSAGNEENR